MHEGYLSYINDVITHIDIEIVDISLLFYLNKANIFHYTQEYLFDTL